MVAGGTRNDLTGVMQLGGDHVGGDGDLGIGIIGSRKEIGD
jgi:hypothetical protein